MTTKQHVDPTSEAKSLIAWIRSKPEGTVFGYDDMTSEIRRRHTDMDFRDVKFIVDKTIRMFASFT